ncbi:MAG TPA: hypothetical protein ENH09_01120 [Bacteroidetes bacterium]|nr:hypothetical protein [Bacteroidota bacterium]
MPTAVMNHGMISFLKGEYKWHAFASANTQLSAQNTLKYYSQRWSIEVFFKNCKQYLNYSKKQMSNLIRLPLLMNLCFCDI